jgi:hypothetical protein
VLFGWVVVIFVRKPQLGRDALSVAGKGLGDALRRLTEAALACDVGKSGDLSRVTWIHQIKREEGDGGGYRKRY